MPSHIQRNEKVYYILIPVTSVVAKTKNELVGLEYVALHCHCPRIQKYSKKINRLIIQSSFIYCQPKK